MKTLKSPMDAQELLRWWNNAVPKSKHPLEDSTMWCIDAWVVGGEGADTRLCAMIQGEFQESELDFAKNEAMKLTLLQCHQEHSEAFLVRLY